MLLDLRDPVADRFEGAAIGHVIHEKNALSAAEIRGGNSSETLLSRSIPDLELNASSVNINVLDFEVNTDGGNEGGGKGIVCVTEEQAGLSNSAVPDHKQLDLHIVGCTGLRHSSSL